MPTINELFAGYKPLSSERQKSRWVDELNKKNPKTTAGTTPIFRSSVPL